MAVLIELFCPGVKSSHNAQIAAGLACISNIDGKGEFIYDIRFISFPKTKTPVLKMVADV